MKEKILFFSSLFAEYRKVTIIGDSIAKHLSGLHGVTLQIFSGRTISQISAKIDKNEANLEPYDYVIIHAGTNDIGNRHSFKELISDFGNLVGICRKKKPSIQIIISGILPRPKDHTISDPVIRDVNKHLRVFMSKSMKFKFVCTYKPFMHAGSVILGLFAKRDLGLHLNT